MAWIGEREIVFSAAGGTADLFRMPVSGGRSPWRLNWAADALWPAVARSQHRLVYVQDRGTENLWRMDLRTRECRMVIGSNHRNFAPQYSPDGRRIAFNSSRTGALAVWTCEADGENCQQRASLGGKGGGTPRWSPDGRWLAFDSREEGKSQIYVIPADGGARKRLTSGDADSMVPSWSRDGHWIYFESDRSGQLRVWKAPSGGGEAVQVTHTGGGAAFESADGKYLYFVSQQGGALVLYRMPTAGGEEKQVAPRVDEWFSFGVTAKGVYFFPDPNTLQLLDERTGRISTVAPLERNSANTGMAVSADDAFVVFAQVDTRADLMLVEGFR
jgi:Tol biopolymer transport system component